MCCDNGCHSINEFKFGDYVSFDIPNVWNGHERVTTRYSGYIIYIGKDLIKVETEYSNYRLYYSGSTWHLEDREGLHIIMRGSSKKTDGYSGSRRPSGARRRIRIPRCCAEEDSNARQT